MIVTGLFTGNMYRRLLAFLIYCLLPVYFLITPAQAQQLHSVRFWGVDEGLPDRNIKCFATDEDGLIWIGTDRGLARFDGRNFTAYSKIDSSNVLAAGTIYRLCYKAPYMWVATSAGLFVLNTRNYQTSRVNLPVATGPGSDKINKIVLLRTGRIAIGGQYGNIWIAESPLAINQVNNPYATRLKQDDILSICDDEHNNIWAVTAERQVLCIEQPGLNIIYHHRFPQMIYTIANLKPYGCVAKCETGIYRIDTTHCMLRTIPEPLFNNQESIGMTTDSDSTLWFYSKGRNLSYFTPTGVKNFDHIFNKIPERNLAIKAFLRTRDCLWIGTDYGICKVSISSNNIPLYFAAATVGTDHSVRGMCEDPQRNLYFASYSGVYKMSYPYDTEKIIPFITDRITYCLVYDNNTLWAGSEGGGLSRINLHTGKSEYFHKDKTRNRQQFIIALYNNSENNELLAGTYGGLSRIDKKTLKSSSVPLHYKGTDFSDVPFFQISRINSNYWFCTGKGLIKCNKYLAPIMHYRFNNRQVYCMIRDSIRNLLWVGTRGGGLYSISEANGEVTGYTVKDGLPDNSIAGLALEKDKLWIGTFNGLSRLEIGKREFFNLSTRDGLSDNEFNHGASFVTREGNIFMGGVNGYNLIQDLYNASRNTKAISPFISSVYVLNEKKDTQNFNCKNMAGLFIPADNKVIEFEFGLTDYNQPEKNIYAYMLEGLHPEWVYMGQRNYLRLAGLKSGNYKLHVKAAGSDGTWSIMPYTLNIKVDDFFYFKWWFIMLVAIVIVLSIVLFYNIRLRQLKKLFNLRLQISSDLHDEVGSILTAVGMQAELLQHAPAEHSRDKLKQISDTSRQAVSNMRDVVWSIDSRNDKYKDLIDRMHEYLALLFENSSTSYEFLQHIGDENDMADLVTRQNAYLIFKEAVNNIARHSDATWIKVELTVTDSSMELSIINNGNPVKAYKAGMGLTNMEMRARKMKSTLTIDTEKNYNITLIKNF
jgi:ligand-binding sensor domain-containing protein